MERHKSVKGVGMSQKTEEESKVIILGLSQSGKTSIRQVIFEGFAPKATALNPATVRINRKLFNLAGGNINLYDIGGQTNYLNELFQQYKERTFTGVKAAVFVVDISDAANIMRSKYYFDLTIQTLNKLSSKARIYVLAHKMDVVPLNKREAVKESLSEIFEIKKYPQAALFGTSIFDDSIWESMQQVLSYVYPRNDEKSVKVRDLVKNYNLSYLSLSTSQGLILYSEPEISSGINFTRMKNDITNAFFPGLLLNQAMFTIGQNTVFMKEIEEDLVIAAVFPVMSSLPKSLEQFEHMTDDISALFKKEEYLGIAKTKMKTNLASYLKLQRLKNVDDLEIKFDSKVNVKCDICGKQIQKSILDVAIENSENLEKGIRVSVGMGAISVEIVPTHECIEGIRGIPIMLDGNLEYRRYEKSRPI